MFGRAAEAGTSTYSSNMVTFKMATEEEVSEVIKRSASTKTSALDPIPTQILKHASSLEF